MGEMIYDVDPVLITPDMHDTHACIICENCTYFTDKGTYGLAVPLDGSAVYGVHCNKCGGYYTYIDPRVPIDYPLRVLGD